MVLLVMTTAIVWALAKAEQLSREEFSELQETFGPSLAEPKVGDPISHSQLIDLSKFLKKYTVAISANGEEVAEASEKGEEHESLRDDSVEPLSGQKGTSLSNLPQTENETCVPTTLDILLRGSRIYIPPPPPRKALSPEYVRLMARLRAEEEARVYERMVNPPTKPETFSQRYPNASTQPAFSLSNPYNTVEEDDVSYAEVHRQIILIINVLVSIIACSVFIWVAARHWSVPKRLGLSMGGSGAVAIAEVVVYSGYVRKVAEAKRLEKKKPEIKEIVQSWVLDGQDKVGDEVDITSQSKNKVDDGTRYRKGKHR